MKYLCLVYVNEMKLEALSGGELQALFDESLDYDEVLRRGGHYIASDALQPVRTATTVRVQERQDAHHRRSLRRDQGAVGRVHPHRRHRPG